MPTDNLTLRYKKQLESRSKITKPAYRASNNTGTLWDNLGKDPVDDESSNLGSVGQASWDLIGSGLWNFADTWSFGAAGLLDEKLLGGTIEDAMYDKDSALASWGGAVGGLVGFMANPWKLAMKGATKVAPIVGKTVFKLGKNTKYLDDVVGNMTNKGLSKGLNKDQAKFVTDQYRTLQGKAQWADDISKNWYKHSKSLMDDIIEKGVGAGKLNGTEAAAVRQMFKNNIKRRPVNDLVDVVQATGKFSNQKIGYFVGNAFQEAVAFGVIDAVMEGTRSLKEDRAYDWTAPLWGAAIGTGFGALRLIPASGKAALSSKDFSTGLKTVFDKRFTNFSKLEGDKLYSRAHGHGEMLKRYGSKAFVKIDDTFRKTEGGKTTPWVVKVKYKGKDKSKKDMWFDMSIADQYKRTHPDIGKTALESMTREALSKSTRDLGGQLINAATRDAAGSLAANWHRMLGGAIVMNARTWYDMYQGRETDINQILPHLFIGAWIQRRGNPASYDMNPQRMNSLRENLHFLGISSPNLHTIPDLQTPRRSYESAMRNNPVMEPVVEKMREYDHVTDATDDLFSPRISKDIGKISVQLDDSMSSQIYKSIHAHSTGLNKHQRPLDDIPVDEANRIVEIFKKQAKKDGYKIDNQRDANEYLEDSAFKSTEAMLSGFIGLTEKISNETQKYTLSADDGQRKNEQLPDLLPSVKLSDEISKDDSIAPGAVDMVNRTFEKVNHLFNHLRGSGIVAFDGERPQEYVQTLDTFRKIKVAIDDFEKKMSTGLPKDQKFDLIESSAPVRNIMAYNFSRKAIERTGNLFDKNNILLFDKVRAVLANVVFGARGDLLKDKLVPDASNRHIEIEMDTPNKEAEDSARAILGSVIDILGAKGQHELLNVMHIKPGEKGYEPYFKVPLSKIKSIQEFLKSNGVLVSENLPFHSEIVHGILRERIEGSSLTSADVTGLNNVITLGYGNYFKPTFGKAAGWSVSKVDMIKVPSKLEPIVKRVNKRLEDIKKNSTTYDKNGKELGSLVKFSDDKFIIEPVELRVMDYLLSHGLRNYDPKLMLLDIVNSTDTAMPSNIKTLIHQYLSTGGARNPAQLLAWMENLKILSRNKMNQIIEGPDFLKLINDPKVIGKLAKKIEIDSGSKLKDIQSNIDSVSRSIESHMSSFEDVSKPAMITMSRFFDKYTVEDGPGSEYKDQLQYINNLLFDDNGNSIPAGIKSLVNTVYVKYNGKETLIKDLPEGSKQSRYKEMQSEIINLVKTRVESKDYPLIAYEDGSLRDSTAHLIKNPGFDDVESIGAKPILITGEASKLVPSAFGSGISRKFFTLFEADSTILNKKQVEALEKYKTHFEDLLDRKHTLLEGTEAELGTKGMILFDSMPDSTKFALRREDLHRLETAYEDFMVELDKAIENKDVSVPNEYKQLHDIRILMLGGDLKKGDSVNWLIDGSNNQSVIPYEFTVRGKNPDNPNKYIMEITPEIEIAIKSNKEIAKDLKIATTEGIERRLLEPDNGNVKPNADEYNVAMRYWKTFKWLKGRENNDWSLFEEAFTSNDPTKMLSRIRLYETKNFGRQQLEIFDGLDLTPKQQKLIDKFRDTSNVMIFDDEANYDIKKHMQKQLESLGLHWDTILNGRSSDSIYDSISYVSKEQMQYLSFVHGFKNWETNSVIKPVISSNKNTVLMGKTLFVYDPYLDNYFDTHDVDILMTKSAAKLRGSDWRVNAEPLNPGVNGLIYSTKGYTKQILSESIGVRSENYQESNLAKRSLSNFNYMDNTESKNMYDRDYREPLTKAMAGISHSLKNHIHTNQFMKQSYKDEGSVQSMMGNESIGTAILGRLRLYNELSDRSNPMDMNPRVVYNALYKHFIDPIVNAKSLAWADDTGFIDKSVGRYGGKAPLVQSLNPKFANMKGTIVDTNGIIRQIGEIALPDADRNARLDHLMNREYELRFIDNTNAKVLNMDELAGREMWDELISDGATLGDVHDFLKLIKESDASNDYSIAVMDNRYPRTRPNDVTYLALRDFVDAKMGNSVIVNPFDVLNVFEGDYDADKTDYYFMQTKEMADHVTKNMAKNWVQGIEPQDVTNVNGNIPLAKFDATQEQIQFKKATANLLVNSKARGVGQTMPRLLKHMTHISNKIRTSTIDQDVGLKAARKAGHNLENKNLILKTDNKERSEYIILDFDSNNIHHDLALKAQTQLDSGAKENNMFDEVWGWSRDVFFGKKDEALEDLSNFDDFNARKPASEITVGNASRPKIFKKLIWDKRQTNISEQKLDVVDQEMLMTIMSNHGKFLQIQSGIFERTGERKKASYEDAWQRSDTYFNFYQDIGKSIYNKLKHNKSIQDNDVYKAKFERIFGEKEAIKPSSKWKQERDKQGNLKGKITKKDRYKFAKRSPFDKMDPTLYTNMHEGLSGHVVDRIYNKIWNNNIFGDKTIDIKLTGKERQLLDQHFDTFLGMMTENRVAAIGQYIDNVKGTVMDINKSIRMIPKLKRKAQKIKFEKVTEDFTKEQKDTALEGLHNAIKSIEEDYGSFIDRDYFKTKRIKDLGDGIKYVSLHKDADMRDGAIQYYTMRELGGIDFSTYTGERYKQMNDEISMLKQLEARYMGDWMGNLDGSKTTFKYGPDITALNKVEQEYLQQFPSRSSFEEIRESIIDRGIERYQYPFLYKYAMPSLNKKRIGIFQGTPIPVPFKSSNRIKVMLGYLAKKAADHDNGAINHSEVTLRRYANISDRYRNLLEDNTQFQPSDSQRWQDTRKVIGLAKEVLDADVGFTNFQIPSFHRDFTRAYGRYNDVKFNINRSDKYSPLLIADNNVFNFYRDIFKASGDEQVWKDFENRISAITGLQIEGRLLDPMSYLATMNSIEGDIVPKINKILSESNFDILKNKVEMQRLRENPLWSVLGGSQHIIGKKMSFQPLDRLSKSNLESVTKLIRQGRDIKSMEEENIKMDEWNRTLKCAQGDIRE